MPLFLFSFSVGWEWKWRVIVSVVHLALQPSENEHSAACGNNNSHVASASLCLKEDGSYFSKLRLVSVEKDWTQLGLKWSALYCHWNDTELSNSTPWHCTWFFFFSKHLQQNVSRLTHIDLFCGFRDITLLLSAPDCCGFRNCQSIQWRKMPKRCQSLFNLNGRAYTKNWLGYYWYRRHGRIRDYTSSKKLYLE